MNEFHPDDAPRHHCGRWRIVGNESCECFICRAVAAGATPLAATEAVRKRPSADADRRRTEESDE